MKKILSLLGTLALSITASASIVACDKKEESNPTPVPPISIKINLNSLVDTVVVSDVTSGDVNNFIDKLIIELQKQQKFNNLSINNIDVYKGGTTEFLQSADIKNSNDLKIKVSAKPTSQNFMGSKNEITVNLTLVKTDLNNLPDSLNITNVNPSSVDSFKIKLFMVIELQQGFGHFDHQVDIYKKGTTNSLNPNDIVNNPNLEVTIIAKNTSNNFKGQKDINVNLTVKTNLNNLPDSLNITLQSTNNTVSNYKTALIVELQKQQKFNNLTENDVDITKSDDSSLQNSDIVQGILNTKVIAKKWNINFINEKTINVTITIT